MISINYDLFLSKPNEDGFVGVGPVLNASFMVSKGPSQHRYLCVPNQEDSPWEWPYSLLYPNSLDEAVKDLKSQSANKLLNYRQVINNKGIRDKDFYDKYVQALFSPIRCGSVMQELVFKLYGSIIGASWGETDLILGGILEKHTPTRPVLRCKIEPLYATIPSILPPFDIKRKKRFDVKSWKPIDTENYHIVWHLRVTLSNGEKYKMYYSISSINKWYDALKQYFEANPTAILSPYAPCGITTHANTYSYERVMEDLNFFTNLTVGVSTGEILVKLSSFFNFPERPVYLQKVLTGKEVELSFSGKVIHG